MVIGFASLLHILLCVNAIVRSSRERWMIGVGGGALRIALMVPAIVAVLTTPASSLLGFGSHPATVGGALGVALLIAAVAGPLVSFGTVAVAWRRTRDVPAAEDERAGRPLVAWVGVAVLDAIFVVIQLGALYVGRDY